MPTAHQSEPIPELEPQHDDHEHAEPARRPQPGTGDSFDSITDQDIDTAGTDADEQSPTRAIGTGIAQPDSRG